MAGNYRAVVTITVWKQHSCVHCGGLFRYLLRRNVTGTGITEQAATAAAETNTHRVVATAINLHPCPTCGLYQPDMVGTHRRRRHLLVFFLFLAACLLPAILGYVTGWAHYVPWVAVGVATAALAAHLFVDAEDPNRRLPDNVAVARRRVERGVLHATKAGDALAAGNAPSDAAWRPAGQALLYGLFLLGVLALPSGELLRLAKGWHFNPDWQPQLVGPGDQAQISFPTKIQSIKGHWSATGKARFLNDDELGGPRELGLTSKTESWGPFIDKIPMDEMNSDVTLWVQIAVPDEPKVAGKTLRIQLDLEVRYPKENKGIFYADVTQSVSQTAELTVASERDAMQKYWRWYGLGLGGGALMTLGLSLQLAQRAGSVRSRALPNEIYTPATRA